jgi:hypothetical protein
VEFFRYCQIRVVQNQWEKRLNELGDNGWYVIHQHIFDLDRGVPVWTVFLCRKTVTED